MGSRAKTKGGDRRDLAVPSVAILQIEELQAGDYNPRGGISCSWRRSGRTSR